MLRVTVIGSLLLLGFALEHRAAPSLSVLLEAAVYPLSVVAGAWGGLRLARRRSREAEPTSPAITQAHRLNRV
jgi:hypothetical protein